MPKAAINRLFLEGRTHHHWLDRPVDDEVLRQLYDLARMPPTSANTQPMRIVFVRSAEAKERLKPAVWPNNVDKVMAAPVTAIVAYDLEFYEQMPKLMPGVDVRSRLAARPPDVIEKMARQSGTLQGGYLILAARALGLDCGPIGGFDTDKVDELFMAGTQWRSNFLLNLGYADHEKLVPRRPRLDFADACRVV
ncbi:MAG: malonic semialdehyde reductase [Vicinamibacterales bacterium]